MTFSSGLELDEVFATYAPEAVIHFATFAYVGESVDDPGKYYRNDFVGSLTLLEAMRDHGVDKIVFSSSCATHGLPDKLPIARRRLNCRSIPTAHPRRWLSGCSLISGYNSSRTQGNRAALLQRGRRDPESEIGESHDPETHLVPLLLDAASGRRKSVTVFGTDYPTQPTSKHSVRSWTAAGPLFTISATAVDTRSRKSSPPSSV